MPKLKYGSKQPIHSDFYYTLDNLVNRIETFSELFANARVPNFIYQIKP